MTFENPIKPQAPSLKTLGDRIRATRYAWNWSQEKLGKALGCDQATVSFWERDINRPAGTAVVALAALFGCTVWSLVYGEGFVVPAFPADLPAFKEES